MQTPLHRDYAGFDRFLSMIGWDVYPEAPAEPHLSITRLTIGRLLQDGAIAAGMRVLDVGCGQGLALAQFRDAGLEAVGIGLGADCQICRSKGFEVHDMDQNFMSFPDRSFDLLWCRHVLEHSVAPLFTLTEYRRVVKPTGLVYVEVPAPDTSAHHESNPNHYSLLPHSAWTHLFGRAGFVVEDATALNFTVPCGPDEYWCYVLRPKQ